MRILIVSGIWPPEVGGPASHGPEFGRFLTARGHRVRAVTTAGRAGPEDPGFPIVAARKDRPRLIRQPAVALTVLRAVEDAEVVYATSLYGRSALATTLRSTPLVIKLVNDPAYERAHRLGVFSGTLEAFQRPYRHPAVRALKRLRNLALSRAARLVIPSHYLAEIARGWGIGPHRIRVVPNPAPAIDGTASRTTLRKQLGLESPTFVFAGRLTPQKNLPLAISALRHVPQGALVVIGAGPSRDEVLRAVSDAGVGDRVTVKGALPRERAIEWMRAADASILPSEWENFPHAAVEALAAGTPVIATAVGGVRSSKRGSMESWFHLETPRRSARRWPLWLETVGYRQPCAPVPSQRPRATAGTPCTGRSRRSSSLRRRRPSPPPCPLAGLEGVEAVVASPKPGPPQGERLSVIERVAADPKPVAFIRLPPPRHQGERRREPRLLYNRPGEPGDVPWGSERIGEPPHLGPQPVLKHGSVPTHLLAHRVWIRDLPEIGMASRVSANLEPGMSREVRELGTVDEPELLNSSQPATSERSCLLSMQTDQTGADEEHGRHTSLLEQ
jgi:glycosyltransferase involved in cell wall biosynthesis